MARFDKGQPNGEPCPALTLPRISTPRSSRRKIPVTAEEVNEAIAHAHKNKGHTSSDDYCQKDLRNEANPFCSWSIDESRFDRSNKDQER